MKTCMLHGSEAFTRPRDMAMPLLASRVSHTARARAQTHTHTQSNSAARRCRLVALPLHSLPPACLNCFFAPRTISPARPHSSWEDRFDLLPLTLSRSLLALSACSIGSGNVLAVSCGDGKVSLWKEALDGSWRLLEALHDQ